MESVEWGVQYLKSLRERENMKHKSKEMNVKLGDVILIQDAEHNRAVQHLFPLEPVSYTHLTLPTSDLV